MLEPKYRVAAPTQLVLHLSHSIQFQFISRATNRKITTSNVYLVYTPLNRGQLQAQKWFRGGATIKLLLVTALRGTRNGENQNCFLCAALGPMLSVHS